MGDLRGGNGLERGDLGAAFAAFAVFLLEVLEPGDGVLDEVVEISLGLREGGLDLQKILFGTL